MPVNKTGNRLFCVTVDGSTGDITVAVRSQPGAGRICEGAHSRGAAINVVGITLRECFSSSWTELHTESTLISRHTVLVAGKVSS